MNERHNFPVEYAKNGYFLEIRSLAYKYTHYQKQKEATIQRKQISTACQISRNIIDVAFNGMHFTHYVKRGFE